MYKFKYLVYSRHIYSSILGVIGELASKNRKHIRSVNTNDTGYSENHKKNRQTVFANFTEGNQFLIWTLLGTVVIICRAGKVNKSNV